jgi:hypothetical protein
LEVVRDATPSAPSASGSTASPNDEVAGQALGEDRSDQQVTERVPSTSAELERLAELHDRGVLSDDEFRLAKARVLTNESEPV